MSRAWLLSISLVLTACTGAEADTADCRPAQEVAAREAPPSTPVAAPAPSPGPANAPEPARTPAITGPRLRILGVAQDGGLPHIACDCPRCDAARTDPARASFVASVAVIGPQRGAVWVIDATPDLPAQLDLLTDVRDITVGAVDRTPLSGIFLTHAHMGHYLGLAHLGYEAAASEGTPVYASARMHGFLAGNAPWDQLLRLHDITPQPATPGVAIELAEGLRAEPLAVPHRGEYTDTFAWFITGPNHRVLYVPDTDPWRRWTTPLDEVLADVDLLLVDGTFYSGEELPGRDIAEIGHPLIVDTMDTLEPRVAAGTLAVWFIHLNHSNPALEPDSPARTELERRGFRVAWQGDEYAL